MEVREGMSRRRAHRGPAHTLREAARMSREGGRCRGRHRRGGAGPADRLRARHPELGRPRRGPRRRARRRPHERHRDLRGARLEPGARRGRRWSQRKIRHLVVVEGGELVGMLSMRDIVRVWTSDGATSSMIPAADRLRAAETARSEHLRRPAQRSRYERDRPAGMTAVAVPAGGAARDLVVAVASTRSAAPRARRPRRRRPSHQCEDRGHRRRARTRSGPAPRSRSGM